MENKICILILFLILFSGFIHNLDLSEYIIIKGDFDGRGNLRYQIDLGSGFGSYLKHNSLSKLLSDFLESGFEVVGFAYQTINYFIIILHKKEKIEGKK